MSAIVAAWNTLITSVVLYIVIPVVIAQRWRRALLGRGQAALDAACARIGPWSITALLSSRPSLRKTANPVSTPHRPERAAVASFLDLRLPNVDSALFDTPTGASLAGAGALAHAPRFVLLYRSLRERSYSKLLTLEAARRLVAMGGEVPVFDPAGLPLPDAAPETHPKVQELREAAAWAEGMVWTSKEAGRRSFPPVRWTRPSSPAGSRSRLPAAFGRTRPYPESGASAT